MIYGNGDAAICSFNSQMAEHLSKIFRCIVPFVCLCVRARVFNEYYSSYNCWHTKKETHTLESCETKEEITSKQTMHKKVASPKSTTIQMIQFLMISVKLMYCCVSFKIMAEKAGKTSGSARVSREWENERKAEIVEW